MAESLVINGTTYSFPDLGDQNWGTNATDWAVAVTNGMLQKAGGSFTLTADVDFGANFGLKSIYLKSRATNPSSAGVLRLGNTETIGWRNFANGGNVLLGCNTSDRIQWNSVDLADVSSTQTFTNKTLTNPVIDTASFSGVVYLSNGSAATPSLAFTNLTASGLFKKGTGLGFTTGGVEAGSIDSSGNWSFAAAVTITGTLLSGNITSSAFISQTANPAGAGAIRLANSDSIKFRNSGNSADIALATGSSNSLIAYASIDLVNISTAQTLTNKTLTSPVIATITNTGTITLPTATCTLVGKDTTDVLTNKTLSGNTAVTLISGSGTLTLNTSGTATIPNGTDTLVNLTGTQTLTGKTVSFPTTGGTPTALNYYEEGTFTANFNQGAGASGSNTSYTVNFVRTGKMVTLVFPAVQPTAGATNAVFSTASATVPATLRPTTSGLFWMNIGKVNGADSATPLQTGISTGGTLSIQRDGTGSPTFTSGSVSGPYGFTMSYTIQ